MSQYTDLKSDKFVSLEISEVRDKAILKNSGGTLVFQPLRQQPLQMIPNEIRPLSYMIELQSIHRTWGFPQVVENLQAKTYSEPALKKREC